MHSKLELVLVLVACSGCLAQEIAFPEESANNNAGSDNRIGGQQPPPWFMGSRPGGNRPFPNQGGFNPNQNRPQGNQGQNLNRPVPNQGSFVPNQNRPQGNQNGFAPNQNRPQPNQGGVVPNQNRPQGNQGSFVQNPQNNQGGFAPNQNVPQGNQGSSAQNQNTQGSSSPAPGMQTPPRSDQKIINQVPCECPFTREYSPVCGSDGQTYSNMSILNCYRVCGFDVRATRNYACSQTAGGLLVNNLNSNS